MCFGFNYVLFVFEGDLLVGDVDFMVIEFGGEMVFVVFNFIDVGDVVLVEEVFELILFVVFERLMEICVGVVLIELF